MRRIVPTPALTSTPAEPQAPPGIPKLRVDLVLSRQGPAGTTGLVVKDPSTGRYFRFGEIEAFLLQSLDGTVPLETLCSRVEEKFGAPLSRAALESFVGRLRSLGLIEEPWKVSTGPPRGGRLRGSLLYLRFKLVDPDRFLGWMADRLGFLFTAPFVVLSAVGIAAAVAVSIANQPEIAHAVRGLYNLRSLLLAWVTVYAVIVIHELAHGLTCKRFGGSVREIGFFLIFFQPAFYCNVSDAWLFPKKSPRLWVTFAGAYVEMFLWALATLAWRVTEPGTVTSQMAVVVMATSAIKTLINLNPLIKLDGYYLLSDALEIPNLRWKAMAYLRGRVSRLAGGHTSDGPPPPRREARIFLVYGLVAGIYSTWLLAYIGMWFGRLLVARYQGWGFVLFAVLFLAVFRVPIARALGSLREMPRTGQALRASLARRTTILAVSTVALAVLCLGKLELKVAGDFNILPIHNADVRSDVEGIIQEIRVREGDHVERGDVIALLSDRDYRAEIGQVGAQIEESQARLRMLREGPRVEEVSLARTSMEKAQERLKYAREKRQMLNTLLGENLVSQKDFAEAEEEVSVREKELEEAQGRLKMLRAGSRPGEIESVAAETRRLEVHQRYLEDQLNRISIASPISGVVTTPKLEERVGEHINKGDLIAKVHDLSTVTAEIAVSESEISDVQVGQKVELRARSFPGQTFHGTVTSIAPTVSQGEEPSAGKSIVVTTRFVNPSLLLKPEMTGTAKIHCGRTQILSLVTRRFFRMLRVEFWSWW